MYQFDQSLKLKELIRLCVDHDSEHRNSAWIEFMRRYKMFMYNVITKKCRQFNIARLSLDFSETVNDIVFQVFFKLNVDQCKALTDFRAIGNEKKFLAYIAIICERTASRYVKKYVEDFVITGPQDQFQGYMSSIEPDLSWATYEHLVRDLREQAGQRKKNSERDIHILMLRKWAELSKPTILTSPCLTGLGEHTLDVVVNRMADHLKQIKKDVVC
jgi:hypothetical protein